MRESSRNTWSMRRPFSLSMRTSSFSSKKEKPLGWNGEISDEARALAGQMNLIANEYDVFKRTEKKTRRENKAELIEELQQLMDHSSKLLRNYDSRYAVILDKMKRGELSTTSHSNHLRGRKKRATESEKERGRSSLTSEVTPAFIRNRSRDEDSATAEEAERSSSNIRRGKVQQKSGKLRSKSKNLRESSMRQLKITQIKFAEDSSESALKRDASETNPFPSNKFAPSNYPRHTSSGSNINVNGLALKKFEAIHVTPLKSYLGNMRQMIGAMEKRMIDLVRDSSDFDVRYKEAGGICGTYNELTGQVEWREMDGGGICGVWNPHLGMVEWKQKRGHGVHGVYNPRQKKVVWRTFKNGGVYGVWNPLAGDIDWEVGYREGVCGVWHPIFEESRFERLSNGGIIGYYDEDEGDIVWKRKKKHGICVVRRCPGEDTYETICCTLANWFKK